VQENAGQDYAPGDSLSAIITHGVEVRLAGLKSNAFRRVISSLYDEWTAAFIQATTLRDWPGHQKHAHTRHPLNKYSVNSVPMGGSSWWSDATSSTTLREAPRRWAARR
jgi:hypothetical protein